MILFRLLASNLFRCCAAKNIPYTCEEGYFVSWRQEGKVAARYREDTVHLGGVAGTCAGAVEARRLTISPN